MNLERKEIDWTSSNILMQIVKDIETPLASIIEANERSSRMRILNPSNNNKPNDVIFSSSQEIAKLIEGILKLAKEEHALKKEPLIFEIYRSNERVQSMCKEKINPNRISKYDTSWLIKMEGEVYKNIDRKDLNLYDLSYSMSVSERQLHRKIKTLLHLTPNKYIRVLKLHKAKELIDNYIYNTISEISYAVGYYDTHYFSKLFNLQYGMSPKELLNATDY